MLLALQVHQDPLGQAGDRRGFANNPGCPAGYCQIWSRNLANGDVAAVLYNRDSTAHNITMDFSLVVPASWQQASLYDLWAHATVGTFSGSYTAAVNPHGVVAVRMTRTQ